MVRGTFRNAGRTFIAGVLPIAAAITFAGVASADPAQGIAPQHAPVASVQTVAAQPVAAQATTGIVLEDIKTNPHAQNSDPMANGAAAGALAGATGSGILSAAACLPTVIGIPICAISGAITGALWGTVIGLAVGAIAPDMVPQVLP